MAPFGTATIATPDSRSPGATIAPTESNAEGANTLAQFTVLRCSGSDARAFLHGQFTCDVAALPPGRWTWGAYCTAKGRVLTTFLLWCEGSDVFLLLPATLAASMTRRLKMYVLRSKAVIEEEHPPRLVLGFVGTVPDLPHGPAEGELLRAADITLLGLTGGRTLAVAPHSQAPALEGAASNAAEWDRLSIQHGEPWILPATQEAFVPQMLNLEQRGGVSFTKGCYPGQEVVARAQHLGEVKRRLYRCGLAEGDVPAAGTALYGDEQAESAGIVVNAARAGSGVAILAVVQTALAGRPLRLSAADGPIAQFVAPALGGAGG